MALQFLQPQKFSMLLHCCCLRNESEILNTFNFRKLLMRSIKLVLSCILYSQPPPPPPSGHHTHNIHYVHCPVLQQIDHHSRPLTCCSKFMMTSTAMLRMPSFVWGLSVFRCVMHIRPSSFNASLMSRIRILQAHATYNACKTTRPLTCMPFPLPCQLWCQYPAQGIC